MNSRFKISSLTRRLAVTQAPAILLSFFAVSAGPVFADAGLDAAAQAACSNMRSCALAEFDAMPADQRAQMQPIIDQISKTMCGGFDQVSATMASQGDAALTELATSCLESMAKMDCSGFEDSNGTPECEQFDQATSHLQ